MIIVDALIVAIIVFVAMGAFWEAVAVLAALILIVSLLL